MSDYVHSVWFECICVSVGVVCVCFYVCVRYYVNVLLRLCMSNSVICFLVYFSLCPHICAPQKILLIYNMACPVDIV